MNLRSVKMIRKTTNSVHRVDCDICLSSTSR